MSFYRQFGDETNTISHSYIEQAEYSVLCK